MSISTQFLHQNHFRYTFKLTIKIGWQEQQFCLRNNRGWVGGNFFVHLNASVYR